MNLIANSVLNVKIKLNCLKLRKTKIVLKSTNKIIKDIKITIVSKNFFTAYFLR